MKFDATSWHRGALQDEELSQSAKAVIGVLFAEAGEKPLVPIARSELADLAGTSERGVYRALDRAKECGWLSTSGRTIELTFPPEGDGSGTETDDSVTDGSGSLGDESGSEGDTSGSQTDGSGTETDDSGSADDPPSPSSPSEAKTKDSTPSKEKAQPPSADPTPDGSSRDSSDEPPSRETNEQPPDAGGAQSGGAREEPEVPPADEYFDDVDRDEVPKSERMDFMMFQRRWKSVTGKRFQKSNQQQRRRALCTLWHFTSDEIDEALETTKREADYPGWGFFKAVLENLAREGAGAGGGGHGGGEVEVKDDSTWLQETMRQMEQ